MDSLKTPYRAAGARCSYAFCSNSRRNNPKISMYKFPKCDIIRNEWIANSGNPKLILMDETTLDKRFICRDHFSSYDYAGPKRLKLGAIPMPFDNDKPLFIKSCKIEKRIKNEAKFQFKSKASEILAKMQMRKKTDPWTNEEMNLAVQLFSINSSCYKFFKNNLKLVLPSISLLRKWREKNKTLKMIERPDVQGSIERICEEGIDTDSLISCECQEVEISIQQKQDEPQIQEIWPSQKIFNTLQDMPGSVDFISVFIAGETINCENHPYLESSGLLIASWLGQNDFLEKIVSQILNLNISDPGGRTPLHLAAIAGNTECCRILIDHGADVNVWDKEKMATPLHCAASSASLGCLKLLLNAGANIEAGVTSSGTGKSPVYYAVQSNAIACLEELLAHGAATNISQVYSETPLHLASSLGLAKCVKLLLEKGADVRAQFGLEKSTPLHLAAQDGNADCCQLLLDAGADSTAKNAKAQTALHLAALAQSAKTVEVLLHHSSDPNAEDHQRRTPLHCAVVSRSCESVHILLKHGVNVNAANAFGYTPAHLAALNECPQCLKLLIDNGADLTKRTKGHISVLSFIARRTPEILRYIESKLNSGICLHDHDLGDVDCEIKLDFQFLAPDIWAGETGLLLAFVEVGERRLLRHPLCEVFLHLKWLKIRKFFVLSLIFHALYVILCSTYILNEQEPLSLQIILFITTISILIKEIFQVAHSYKKYISHWENWLQWFIIVSVSLVLFPKPWLNDTFRIYFDHISVYSIFFNWIELMVIMGRFPMFGLYVQMFTKGAVNFAKFLLAYCCILLAFAFAFRITFSQYKSFQDIAISFVKTVVMLTGELEFEDIFFPETTTTVKPRQSMFPANWTVSHPGTSHLFFLLFTLIVTTVLANLLVGLSVSDIQGLQRSAGLDRLVRQVEVVAYMESLLFSTWLMSMPKPFVEVLKRNATLLCSARQWTLIIRPNDPREKRIPTPLIKSVYNCVAEKREIKCSRKEKKESKKVCSCKK